MSIFTVEVIPAFVAHVCMESHDYVLRCRQGIVFTRMEDEITLSRNGKDLADFLEVTDHELSVITDAFFDTLLSWKYQAQDSLAHAQLKVEQVQREVDALEALIQTVGLVSE